MSERQPAQKAGNSNFQVRVVSAVALAAMAIAALWFGGLPFRALAAIGGFLVYWEWQSITGYDKYGLLELAAPAAVVACIVLVVLNFPVLESIIPAAFATLFAAAACARRGMSYWFPLGVPYAILPVLGLVSLRADTHAGLAATVFLFAIVWATDIFAYLCGRAIGGPKLAPGISPNKTWSGSIGGAVAAVVAGLSAAGFFGASGLWFLALLSLALSLSAQAGDLFESYVKRRFGVKDSGTIIPGHGGVMDRVDGLIAAIIVLYAICALMGYAGDPAAALFP